MSGAARTRARNRRPAALARHLGLRRVYTHLDPTNPLLDPVSPARARSAEEGVEVLPDGTELIL